MAVSFQCMTKSTTNKKKKKLKKKRILEWTAMSSSRGFSWPRDQTHTSCGSCICRWIFYHCAMLFLCVLASHLLPPPCLTSSPPPTSLFSCLWHFVSFPPSFTLSLILLLPHCPLSAPLPTAPLSLAFCCSEIALTPFLITRGFFIFFFFFLPS